MTHYETLIFITYCKEMGLPPPKLEFTFCKGRKWRFDFVWLYSDFEGVKGRVALEVEGGVFSGGRHTRGAGFLKDIEKYNTAQLLGFILLRTTPTGLCKIETIEMVRKALKMKGII